MVVNEKGQPKPQHISEVIAEVTLDYRKPLAREYNERDIFEQVTVQDTSPSLRHMVQTGQVGGTSGRYYFPDTSDNDDENHDLPDEQRLSMEDPVIRSQYVDSFVNNPNNYNNEEHDQDPVEIKEDPEPKVSDPKTSTA